MNREYKDPHLFQKCTLPFSCQVLSPQVVGYEALAISHMQHGDNTILSPEFRTTTMRDQRVATKKSCINCHLFLILAIRYEVQRVIFSIGCLTEPRTRAALGQASMAHPKANPRLLRKVSATRRHTVAVFSRGHLPSSRCLINNSMSRN